MRTLSPSKLKDWCINQGVALDDRGIPADPGDRLHRVRCQLPENLSQLTWFCRFIEASLQPRDHCLLWVTRWGVWPSSENWHLYYRLRETYGDHRLLDEAPGHLFLQHESADLISFLEIGLLAGWDLHLIPTVGYGRVFVSHDEWVEFALENAAEIEEIKTHLLKAGVKLRRAD